MRRIRKRGPRLWALNELFTEIIDHVLAGTNARVSIGDIIIQKPNILLRAFVIFALISYLFKISDSTLRVIITTSVCF